ncbi:MAG TPA: hypothetical protein VGE40_13900 [Bacilli bacterium]
MEMETVTLSRIVMKFTPEWFPFLKPKELQSSIILRDGIEVLDADDAREIIQQSIFEHQKDAYLH